MSLLNDALRKKQEETNNPGANPLVRNMSGEVKTGYKKNYYVAIVMVLFFSVVVYGSWRFFINPVISPKKTMLTKRLREGQTFNKHSDNELAESRKITDPPKITLLTPAKGNAEPAPRKIQNATSNIIVEDKSLQLKPDLLMENKKTDFIPEVQKENMPYINKAIKEQKKISQKKDSSPEELSAVDAMFYKKALSYHRADDLKKSIQMYEEIIRKNPAFDAARFNLSAVYIQESMFSKAYPVLKQLLAKDPENAQVLLNLAIVEIGINNPGSAIDYLRLAETKENQPNFAVYFHLGIANSKLDNFTDALTWYNKAKNIEPRNPNLLFNLGIVYERLNEYNHAVKHYESSLKYGDSFTLKQRRYIKDRIQVLKRFLLSR